MSKKTEQKILEENAEATGEILDGLVRGMIAYTMVCRGTRGDFILSKLANENVTRRLQQRIYKQVGERIVQEIENRIPKRHIADIFPVELAAIVDEEIIAHCKLIGAWSGTAIES